MKQQGRQSGFTLAALIITVAIVAILLVFAVPAYLNFIESNGIQNASNQFVTAANFARMEAIHRGVAVGVCAAQTAAAVVCGSATNWTNGWIVFVDADENNQVDSAADVLSVSPALAPSLTVTANTNIVMYSPLGSLIGPPMALVVSSLNCAGNAAVALSIFSSGQINVDQTACLKLA